MTHQDWIKLITLEHDRNAGLSGFKLVINNPVETKAIIDAEEMLGLKLPQELFELYGVCNGFGVKWENCETDWNFVPISRILEFTIECRGWFSSTHPDTASRFLPFYDMGSGDCLGYLFNQDQSVSGLYEFSHELYEFSQKQDPKEFLFLTAETINQFLRSNT